MCYEYYKELIEEEKKKQKAILQLKKKVAMEKARARQMIPIALK